VRKEFPSTKNGDDGMTEDFEKDDVLVGWYSTIRTAKGRDVQVFIPRRDEDIAEDRSIIRAHDLVVS
jgi:hypothetical protein